jgi:hypothetical protein
MLLAVTSLEAAVWVAALALVVIAIVKIARG